MNSGSKASNGLERKRAIIVRCLQAYALLQKQVPGVGKYEERLCGSQMAGPGQEVTELIWKLACKHWEEESSLVGNERVSSILQEMPKWENCWLNEKEELSSKANSSGISVVLEVLTCLRISVQRKEEAPEGLINHEHIFPALQASGSDLRGTYCKL